MRNARSYLMMLLAVGLLCASGFAARRPTPAPAPAAAAASADATAVAAAAPATHVKLPAPITGVTAAKGGQYLILQLRKLHQLAIFDVKESKIIKYLPLASDDVVIAGSASKIFIGMKDKRQIQRIDLAKLEVDLTVNAPAGGIAEIAAGANADGPVLLLAEQSAKTLWMLNPVTLEAEKFPSKHWGGNGGGAWGPVHIHVSFDGSATVANGGGWAGIEVGAVRGMSVEHVDAGGYVNGEALISGNGSMVFPSGGAPLHADLAESYPDFEGTPFPTESAEFSLALRKEKNETVLVVFPHADPRPILTLHQLPEIAGKSKMALWERIHLIPQYKSLVTVSDNAEELLVRRFDLADELNASGVDYLFVESSPITSAKRGTAYNYPITVLSKRGGVKMELQGAPPGMTLSPTGTLAWNVPADFGDSKPAVIISISDASGQSIFHAFTLDLGAVAAGVASAAPQTPAAPAARPVPGASAGAAQSTAVAAANPPAAAPAASKAAAPAAPAAAPPAAPVAKVSPAEATVTTVHLDEPFHEFHAAAGGKSLVFYLPKARQLAVYDTSTGRALGSIRLGADNIRFAAGLDTIVVALPDQGILQAYSLKTLQRVKSAAIPDRRPLKDIRMGNAGKGPVILYFGGELVAVDAATLEPLKLKGSLPSGNPDWWFTYRISADGNTIVSWDPYASPSDFSITHIANGAATKVNSPDSFSMATRRFTPTADGSLVLYGMSFFNAQARKVDSAITGYENAIPTSDPRFFIAVKNSEKRSSAVAVCTVNDRRVLTEIPTVGDVGDTNGYDGGRCGVVMDLPGAGEPRVIFLPESNILAALVTSNDQFTIRKISLQAPTASQETRSGPTSLAVVSLPPPEVAVLATYSYQIQVIPEKAAVHYKVEAGPPGLAVSAGGLVTWKPETRPIGGRVKVILSITDAAGNEIPHAFDIAVVRGGSAASAGPGAVSIVRADEHRIELPSGNYQYSPGYNGHALILSGNQLAITASDGFTIQEAHVLAKSYVAIAERKDYFVALCQEPRGVDILDKKTFTVRRSRAIAFAGLDGIVLHPNLPISYISYHQPSDTPSHHFMIFDEATAEARTDDNWIGDWLAIAPDGGFLMTGFQETYRDGSEIIDNPDRVWIVPTYGSIDTLVRYDLGRSGMPEHVAFKEGVGGNGAGIRLSADGKRVTYLSHVGYPQMSSNLGGWDPLDLSKLPVAYATKNGGTTMELAFHPLLPLVASPGKGSVAFFNRESGAPESDRIASDELAGENIEHVYFSPDGKTILLDTVAGEIHYLLHLPLKLSSQELQAVGKLPRLDKPLESMPSAPAPSKPQKLPVVKA